jgi:hypothetical protein
MTTTPNTTSRNHRLLRGALAIGLGLISFAPTVALASPPLPPDGLAPNPEQPDPWSPDGFVPVPEEEECDPAVEICGFVPVPPCLLADGCEPPVDCNDTDDCPGNPDPKDPDPTDPDPTDPEPEDRDPVQVVPEAVDRPILATPNFTG